MKNVLFIVFISLLITACSSNQPKVEKEATSAQLVEMELEIQGMTCDNCETSIQAGVSELPGVDSISANYEDSTAYVRFDSTKTNLAAISDVIAKRGYVVK
ncbi:MAG TPA: heavy metal-associated domain-containing protein [Prolixibacteraceae bacterium]|nr:heavy metal-associated domain-containing protein [Prolixibacteraceae bacterium]